jgi:hypothetical protein
MPRCGNIAIIGKEIHALSMLCPCSVHALSQTRVPACPRNSNSTITRGTIGAQRRNRLRFEGLMKGYLHTNFELIWPNNSETHLV